MYKIGTRLVLPKVPTDVNVDGFLLFAKIVSTLSMVLKKINGKPFGVGSKNIFKN
jgi:hypothetical protein